MKQLILLAAAAVMAVGCARNEAYAPSTSGSTELSFNVLNGKASKVSEGYSAGANDDGDDIFVIIDNPVSTTDGEWTYTAILDGSDFSASESTGDNKWPAGEISVYAFAADTATNLDIDMSFWQGRGSMVGTYTVADEATEDFTVATPQKSITFESNKSNTITLAFEHMLSKLSFNLTGTDVLAGESFGEGTVGDLQTGYTIEFLPSTKTGTVDVMATTPALTATNATNVIADRPSFKYTAGTALEAYEINMIPQTSVGAIVRVKNLTFGTGEAINNAELADYIIKTGDVVSTEESSDFFLPGYKYNLNLGVAAGSLTSSGNLLLSQNILFEAEVADWATPSQDVELGTSAQQYLLGNLNMTANSYIVSPTNKTYIIPINERINNFWAKYATYEEGDSKFNYLIKGRTFTNELDSEYDDSLYAEILWYDASTDEGTANGSAPIQPVDTTWNETIASCGISNIEIIDYYSSSSEFETNSLTDKANITTASTVNYTINGSSNVAMKFTVPTTAAHGNILVAVKNKRGDILWSWHFWVTNYNPYATVTFDKGAAAAAYTVTGGHVHRYNDAEGTALWGNNANNGDANNDAMYANAVIMDRNLGATAATFEGHGGGESTSVAGTGSLFYQFGRSVPQPGKLGTTPTVEEGEKDFVYSVKNPLVYVANGSTWSTQDNSVSYMWHDKNVVRNTDGKSIFDPSPIGWRLPINGTWSAFNRNSDESQSSFTTNGTTSGRTYTDASAYYPYSGRRLNSSGDTSNIGSTGYYWTSTPQSATTGSYLLFYSSSVNPTNSNTRAWGYTLRPVRE